MTPFDFVNSINFSKENLFQDPQAEKDYVPFLVNRALSYFPDTVLLANEMNCNSTIPKKWQFDFYTNAVSKRRRFSKWAKKEQSSADLAAVQEFYKYSSERALEAISILTKEQINFIKQQMDKGGKS